MGSRIENRKTHLKRHEGVQPAFFYLLPGIPTKQPRLKKCAIPTKNIPVGSVQLKKFNSPQKRERDKRALKRKTVINNCPTASLITNKPRVPFVETDQAADEFLLPENTKLSTVVIDQPSTSRAIFIQTDQEKDEIHWDAADGLLQLSNARVIQNKEVTDFGVQVTPSIIVTDKFTIADILKSNKQLRAFTGITTLEKFNKVLEAIKKMESINPNRHFVVRCRDRLMMCLIKLKLNLTYVCLSALFEVTGTSCRRYFGDMISKLAQLMKHTIRFPLMSEIRRNLPKCFTEYKNCRIVLDATEVKIEKSKCLRCRIATYSHYKGCHTLKVLIGTTPSGLISYVSKCYGGRTSDKAIFMQSNLLHLLEPQEAIMVDKGFLIENECRELGIILIRPPFLRDRKQMSPKEAIETSHIAAARVHVERAIQRMKIFKILKTDVSYDLLPYCDDIVVSICGLCNLSAPILSDDKFLP